MNIPLTDEQKEILINTPDDSLKKVFPNLKRDDLRAWKRELKKDIEMVIKEFERQDKVQTLENQIQDLYEKLKKTKKEKDLILKLKSTPQEYQIKPVKSKKIEAVTVTVASDWHIEEKVELSKTNGINEFNLDIADRRINYFFNNTLRLIKKEEKDTRINKHILALLGDFISGNIHEELLENAELRPMDAILWVYKRIKNGIEFLLDNTKKDWVIVCHAGNHSRITKKIRPSTETGNSLEYLMYHFLKNELQDKRITWIIADGYHTYLDVFGYKLRFHHGHAIRYRGGIGGITIPANKKINNWNATIPATLDIFGHSHTLFNGGNFIINGSLIGYNPYGLIEGYKSERPRQKFFLFTSKGEVTGEYVVFLE